MNKNNSFCILPWISYRNYIGKYFSICCHSTLEINEENFCAKKSAAKKVWNSEEIKKLRKDLMNGIKNKTCKQCWEDEKNGVSSKRQYYNGKFNSKYKDIALKQTQKDGHFETDPILLNVSFGSFCDFRCRMCALPKKVNHDIINNAVVVNNVVNKEHFKRYIFPFLRTIEHVTIAGGEPLVIKNVEYFLKKCVERGYSKNISVQLITNFNNNPQKILKLLSSFKECQIDISIDGIDNLHEYIRYPGKWSQIKSNFTNLKNLAPNIKISITIAVQIYNIFNLSGIVDFVYQLKKHYKNDIWLYFNFVYNPNFFSVKNLPDKIKIKAIKKSIELFKFDKDEYYRKQVENLINFINTDTDPLINGNIVELRKMAKYLISYYVKNGIRTFSWFGQFSCRSRRQMNENDYVLCRKAGLSSVSIGIESGSEKIRKDMNKFFSNKDIDFTFRQCEKNGISLNILLIIGYPTETEKDFQKTLRLLKKYSYLNEKKLISGLNLGPTLGIMPNTLLYEKAKQEGLMYKNNPNNWEYKKTGNTQKVRVERWLKARRVCMNLGYPVDDSFIEQLKESIK